MIFLKNADVRWVYLPLLLLLFWSTSFRSFAQTALVEDAWWSFQQDCDGDAFKAGMLPGNTARLNWNPDVLDCSGTLTVMEIVYVRAPESSWIPIFTNISHAITGCRSSDAQYVDIQWSSAPATNDYKIEIYRTGETTPDFIRSNDNDSDLANHGEENLADDFCLSDNFSTSATLNGAAGTRTDNNTHASKEPGEPQHTGNSGGRSLWYSWTAPTSDLVTIETAGSGFDTVLAIYTGEALESLSLVAENDDIAGATNRQSRITFTPTAGITYRIAVDGFSGASGLVSLNWIQSGSNLPDLIFWAPAVSPQVISRTFAPDECEVLEGCAVEGTRTLISFTTETRNIGTGDLVLGDASTNSLFNFASCHGHYHFEQFAEYDLLDGNGNIVVSGHKVGFCLLDDFAWSSSANPLPRFDCNNQGIQAGWADVYAAGLPCQYIDVTGVPSGEYVLRLVVNPYGLLAESDTNNNTILIPVSIPESDCVDLPPNNAFTNAVAISGMSFTLSQYNQCATKEDGEPDHASTAGGHSLWYSWVPGSTHNALITTKRSDYNTVLAIYTGDSVTNLTLVGSNDDITGSYNPQSEVFFEAVAGTTYYIAVDGFEGAVGTTVLNVNPPANDDFDEPFPLVGSNGSTNGTNVGASKHLYEPAHASDVGGNSVWYTWTAPTNGPVEFNTFGSTFNTTLAVYTGNHLYINTVIAGSNDAVGGVLTSQVNFVAEAGTTYEIAIDGAGGDVGNLVLNWTMDSQLAVAQQFNGNLAITVTGVPWQRYLLLSSTNLFDWITNRGPVTMTHEGYKFTNSAPAGMEFYQSFLLP